VDSRNGKLLWSHRCGDRWYDSFSSSPTVVGTTLYTSAFDGNIYCFDTRKDSIKWVFQTGSEISSSVAYWKGRLFFGGPEGVYSLNARDGTLVWKNDKIGGLIYSSPAIASDRLFIGATDGSLYSLSLSDGRIEWSHRTGYQIMNAPAVSGERVFVSSAKVYALSIGDGRLLWKRDLGAIVNTSPALAHSMVYVGCDNGWVYALSQQTGQVRWSHRTGDIVLSSPTVADRVVYFGSRDKNLYAFDALTGDSLWSYGLPAFVDGSPVIGNGFLYIGANDGYLYAFSGKKEPYRPVWVSCESPAKMRTDQIDTLKLTVKNDGGNAWGEEDRLHYSWIDKWELTQAEGEIPIPSPVQPQETLKVDWRLTSPPIPGDYLLRVALEHKGKGSPFPLEKRVKVELRDVANPPFPSSYLPTSYFGFEHTLQLLKGRRKAALLVDASFKDSLEGAIRRYEEDVESNFEVDILTHWGDWEEPAEVRSLLQDLYSNEGISGAILVGDLPVPMWKAPYGKFPISLYYEDLEGTFIDSTGGGFFERHIWGRKKEAQIWVSWIRPPRNKIANLIHFFDKCHSYYTGRLIPPRKALVYCGHNDYGCAATIVGKILGSIYGGENVVTVGNRWLYGSGERYFYLLQQGWEIVDVWSHASSLFHQFNTDPQRNLYSWRIREVPQGGVITFIWGCHAGDFVEAEANYCLPNAYLFGNSMGLAVVAATRSIGTDGHDLVYRALKEGADLGTAFLAYKREICIDPSIHKRWSDEDVELIVWGVSLFGNPFLSIKSNQGRGIVTRGYWNKPVANAEVRFSSDEQPVLTLFTAEDGHFTYDLRPGRYGVEAREGGSLVQTQITVQEESLPNISLVLPDKVTHLLKEGTHLFSVPLQPVTPEVDSIFSSDSLTLKTWKKNEYQRSERIEPGYGYLIKLDEPLAVDVEGVKKPVDMPYTIPLEDGWNLIGNPFDFEVDWNRAEVEWMAWGRLPQRRGLIEAGEARWIKPTLWEFMDNGYRVTDRLLPWRGYWLKAYALGNWAYGHPNLRIYPSLPPTEGGSPLPFGTYDWYIQLIFKMGDMIDPDNYLGVARGASKGFDCWDVEKPPLPPKGIPFCYGFFPHPAWGSEAGNYAVDMRDSVASQSRWDLTLISGNSEEPCQLRWIITSVPRQYRLTLLDLETASRIDMREKGEYSFKPQKPRRFKVIVGR